MAVRPAKEKHGRTLERQIAKLSEEEVRELLVLSMYKLAMTRAHVDALSDLLVKKKVVKREELWDLTAEKFDENKF